ncbi:GNAT family N-acetyltransferase [Kangiella marina]|uniref:GNAT family N-acetyltransferase n=1 Tax=Kangiella marina TaxID=1079178 RepID=A0ABP8IAE1_9GAMM
MKMMIQEIEINDVYPLRQRVLRPGQPIESCHFPEDTLPGVFHLGASVESVIVGIASFYPEKHPKLDGAEHWRLRGMATDERVRGQGLGRELLLEGIKSCAEKGADLLWCNARVSAADFYHKLNFEIHGEAFIIENIGPHFLMSYKY